MPTSYDNKHVETNFVPNVCYSDMKQVPICSFNDKTHFNNVNLDSHHSVNFEYQKFGSHLHPPQPLNARRKPLRYPSNKMEWEKLNNELVIALQQRFSRNKLKSISCDELVSDFEKYLYNFILDHVDQGKDIKKSNCGKKMFKPNSVKNIEKAIIKNRMLKNKQSKFVKTLKKSGLFFGDLAIDLTRIWRKLLKKGNKLRRRFV